MSNMSKKEDENLVEEIVEPKKTSFFRKVFFVLILLIILTIVYARYIGTTGLNLKEYTITNENISSSFNGFKIAQFSDFHYGRTTGLKELKYLIEKLNLTKPDIVIFSGDFIDKDTKITDKEVVKLSKELQKINSTYGKYYITGNHDIKCKSYNTIFDNGGFTSLDDNFDTIYSKSNESILLVGLNYKSNNLWLDDLFKNNLPTYKILVMHMPDVYDKVKDYNFNLVLAGHSHNGQVRLPGYGAIIKPNGAKKYYKPYYKINNTDFYISSGIGTSTINYRLFDKPSFNLYRLNTK